MQVPRIKIMHLFWECDEGLFSRQITCTFWGFEPIAFFRFSLQNCSAAVIIHKERLRDCRRECSSKSELPAKDSATISNGLFSRHLQLDGVLHGIDWCLRAHKYKRHTVDACERINVNAIQLMLASAHHLTICRKHIFLSLHFQACGFRITPTLYLSIHIYSYF
jgi:hypothetical protein